MKTHIIFYADIVTPRAALLKLNRMYGWMDGVAALDKVPTDEHQEATHALTRTTRLALCMSFDETGAKRFTILDETDADEWGLQESVQRVAVQQVMGKILSEVEGSQNTWGEPTRVEISSNPPLCIRCRMPIESAYTMTQVGPAHHRCVGVVAVGVEEVKE